MTDQEVVPCPLCRSEQRSLFCRATDRFSPQSSERYSLQRCLDCGMVYLSPRPTEMDSPQFYQHADYLPFASLGQEGSVVGWLYRIVRRLNLRWKRQLVDGYWRGARAAKPGRLLDVGCGTGEFLSVMKREGWEVEGLERDEHASAFARTRWGVSVFTGGVENIPRDSRSYDVITLWHVLEHLYDPARVLSILKLHLSAGGLLLIATPNVEGFDSRVYKENWIALDVPRHVNHFSSGSLNRLLTEGGFEFHACRQLPFDPFFNTLLSEQLAARQTPGWGFLWPFRLIRAGLVSISSLISGSRLFGSKFGATLVCVFRAC